MLKANATMNVRLGITTPAQKSVAQLRPAAVGNTIACARMPVRVACGFFDNGVVAKLPEGHKNSQWPTGVPPQMGGHLMPSGTYAPLSFSTGCATGIPHLFKYHENDTETAVKVFQNAQEGGEALAQMIAEASAKAIAERGIFTIALSGKETAQALSMLGKAVRGVDFANWHVFFTGEKCVPLTSEHSNYKWAQEYIFSKVPIPPTQVYAIEAGTSALKAAQLSDAQLRYLPAKVPRTGSGFPVLDVVVLDVGQRGEIASLYPNRATLKDIDSCVTAITDAPSTPKEQISFTLPLINSAANVAVVAFGEAKRDAVSRALECQALPGSMPVQLVRPTHGKVTYVLDAASAAGLSTAVWDDWKKWPRSEIPRAAK